jgi:hypothetical protein
MKTSLPPRPSSASRGEIAERVSTLAWTTILSELDVNGCAIIRSLLSPAQCEAMAGLYAADEVFRSRVDMARHGFGRGEYKYFAYPLPRLIQGVRSSMYPHLAEVANRWNELLSTEVRFPADHAAFIERCHAVGQVRPTPLLLQYGPGDFNCLHQDVYGEHVFPFQVAILLKEPEVDFTGGEFVLTEQRPRMQSRVEVVPLRRGDGVIFPVGHRPVRGTRGVYRVTMRHGVSRVRSGGRHALGIIFHDAT